MSLNKVMLIGHLGADPEVRYTQEGKAVANLRIATSESWKDKQGNKQERTEWHKVIAFGAHAELCQKYLHKGRQVYIEGKLQTKQWKDKDGNKRYTTEIITASIVFLGSKDGYQGGGSSRAAPSMQPGPQDGDRYDEPDYSAPDPNYPF